MDLKWNEIEYGDNGVQEKLFNDTMNLPDEKLPFFMCRKNDNELIGKYTMFVDGRPVELSVDIPEQFDILQHINETGSAVVCVNYHYHQFSTPLTRLWFSFEHVESTSDTGGDYSVVCRVRLSRDGKHGLKLEKIS